MKRWRPGTFNHTVLLEPIMSRDKHNENEINANEKNETGKTFFLIVILCVSIEV